MGIKTNRRRRQQFAGLTRARVADLVRRALHEDVGSGDVTTDSLVSAQTEIKAVIFARADIVVSGNEIAKSVFKIPNPKIRYSAKIKDGNKVKSGEPIADIRGRAGPILRGERTALNFMQRMSGTLLLPLPGSLSGMPWLCNSGNGRYWPHLSILKRGIPSGRNTPPGWWPIPWRFIPGIPLIIPTRWLIRFIPSRWVWSTR